MKSFFRSIYIVYQTRSIKARKYKDNIIGIAKEYFSKAAFEGQFFEEKDIWKRNIIGCIREGTCGEVRYFKEVLYGFFEEPIIPVKVIESNEAVVYTSAIKNDIVYLKEILPHYRKLGVRHFIFIDNGSTDGSLEFLKNEKDVSVYSAPYTFNGRKKVGWKLQAIAINGLNKWYLWMDSDEFLIYPECEKKDIHEYLKECEQKGIDHIKGFMLDMYPKYEMMDGLHQDNGFINDYIFFDKYSKYYDFSQNNKRLSGGMRARVMSIEHMKLDKIPIAFCKDGLLFSGNHTIFPTKKNNDSFFGCVLKHYKFLPSDLGKYQHIADNNGAGYYDLNTQKKYVKLKQDGKRMNAYNETFSVEYINYDSLSSFKPIMKG